ncbi:MAG: DUF4380 domain-containing protein [Chloroherpetonaceae bacterium]|nr:DUF4380 domain-containing protein [Chthonomonadaceae bacterium]MDW8206203.1 DUF4380 domain-containing protein [Chloroherpetonaceae bacterium]
MERIALLIVLLGTLVLPLRADVTVRQVTYQGWSNAYLMSNGTVELIFVPQIGRILHYGYVRGPNLLWVNSELAGKTINPEQAQADWPNYGGDKLWPAPQNRWGWPPDPALDSGVHTARVLKGGRLQVTGQPSEKHGIRFSREIVRDPVGTGVTIRNTMTNVSAREVQWAVWQVTQVDAPDVVLMPLYRGGRFPKGYYVFKDADPAPNRMKILGEEIRLERDPERSSKIGGDSPKGWLAAEKQGIRFEVSAKVEPKRTYPDDGCALEIYTNPDPHPYVELELLSPIVSLAPGRSYSFTTRWKLSRVLP